MDRNCPGPRTPRGGGLRAAHPHDPYQTIAPHILQPQQLPQGPLPVQENIPQQNHNSISFNTLPTRVVNAASGGKISNHKKKKEAAAAKKKKEAAAAKKKKETAAAKKEKEAAAAKKKKETKPKTTPASKPKIKQKKQAQYKSIAYI